MNKDDILCYLPGQQEPQKVCSSDIFKTVNEVCGGYEEVHSRVLNDILQDAIFICDDNFIRKAYPRNNVGTLLYDFGFYPILGSICIVKCIACKDGYDLVGLKEDEVSIIVKGIQRLHELNRIIKSKYTYQHFINDSNLEFDLITNLSFKFIYYAKKASIPLKNNQLNRDLLTIHDLESLFNQVYESEMNPDSTCEYLSQKCSGIMNYAYAIGEQALLD